MTVTSLLGRPTLSPLKGADLSLRQECHVYSLLPGINTSQLRGAEQTTKVTRDSMSAPLNCAGG